MLVQFVINITLFLLYIIESIVIYTDKLYLYVFGCGIWFLINGISIYKDYKSRMWLAFVMSLLLAIMGFIPVLWFILNFYPRVLESVGALINVDVLAGCNKVIDLFS